MAFFFFAPLMHLFHRLFLEFFDDCKYWEVVVFKLQLVSIDCSCGVPAEAYRNHIYICSLLFHLACEFPYCFFVGHNQ